MIGTDSQPEPPAPVPKPVVVAPPIPASAQMVPAPLPPVAPMIGGMSADSLNFLSNNWKLTIIFLSRCSHVQGRSAKLDTIVVSQQI